MSPSLEPELLRAIGTSPVPPVLSCSVSPPPASSSPCWQPRPSLHTCSRCPPSPPHSPCLSPLTCSPSWSLTLSWSRPLTLLLFCLMNHVQRPGFQGGMGEIASTPYILLHVYSYEGITVHNSQITKYAIFFPRFHTA